MFARSLPVLLTGALLATSVLAQTTTSPPPAATTEAAKPHPDVEKRIAQLSATLKITPAQTKAFDDFAQVMRDNADKLDALIQARRQTAPTLSAVDQMKSYEEQAQARADEMHRLVPAFSQLYDTLTPEQKKIADDDFRNSGAGRPPRR